MTRNRADGDSREPRRRRTVDPEVHIHLEMQVEDLVRRGWDRPSAEREALRRFGDPVGVSREMHRLDQHWERRMQRLVWLWDLPREMWRGVRSLVRQPGFVAVTIAVLGVGIGSTVVVADLAMRVLVTPLPYPAPDRLVSLWTPDENNGRLRWPTTRLDFMDWREQLGSFERLVAHWRLDLTLNGTGAPQRLAGQRISSGALAMLGVEPALGRDFRRADESRDTPVAMLSDRLWRNEFAADPGVIGTTIRLNNVPHVVVAVAPPAFHFPDGRTDVWTPVHLTRATANRNGRFLRVTGRLADGVTVEQAQGEFTAFAEAIAGQYPETHAGVGGWVVGLHGDVVSDVEGKIVTLTMAVVLMLLLTCANVSGLLLIRGTRRRGEFAVHSALGAGRGRIVRSILVESALLAVVGGALGLGLAVWGVDLTMRFVPDALGAGPAGVGLRVTAIAAGVTAVAVLLAGLIPALRSSTLHPADALRGLGRMSEGRGVRRIQSTLLSFEVAVAVTVTVGAGLLGQSMQRLSNEVVGFDTAELGTARIELPSVEYGDRTRRTGFYNGVLAQLAAAPGVESAAFITFAAMRHPGAFLNFRMPGDPQTANQAELIVFRQVTPGYFDTMRMPVLAGRSFRDGDDAAASTVITVNEQFVRRYLPGREPLGVEIPIPQFNLNARIVGIVGDVRQYDVSQAPRPHVYVPEAQIASFGYYSPHDLVFRTTGDPMAVLPAVRRAVTSLDPEIPVFGAQEMRNAVRETIAPAASQLQLFATLAAAALVLAGLGVFAVTSFLVQTRQRELGLRSALGATRRDLIGLVVADGVRAAGWGALAGMAGAVVLGRSLQAQLHETAAWEPAVIVLSLILLAVSLCVACWLPARRAVRLDPVRALRAD